MSNNMGERFINEIAPYIIKHAPKYNILCISAVLGQAYLESAFGTSELAVNANNYFGMKYRSNRCPTCSGIYYKIGSEQNPDGSYVSSNMQWMKFNNMEDCVIGYFDFTNISNYKAIQNVEDPRTYLINIKAAGYATSIDYVDKVMNVINTHNLTRFDNLEKIEEEKGDKNNMLINIDAGHASNTAGKRTPDGYREHYANVKVASFFAEELDRLGIKYMKTGWNDANGYDDEEVTLSDRQKAIKKAGANISISFHFNAFGDGASYNDAHGVETLISNKYPADSRRLAELVQEELIKGTKQRNRGVKEQALSMCNCNVMKTDAAILIECAFMTNKEEADLMQTDMFCKECAIETARGLCKYLGIEYINQKDEEVITKPVTTKKYIVTYTVVKGDTLGKIAKIYNVELDDVVKTNNIKNPNLINIGQKIIIEKEKEPEFVKVKTSGSTLRLRAFPNLSCPTISFMANGTELELIANINDDWAHVKYQDKTGFAHRNYLK